MISGSKDKESIGIETKKEKGNGRENEREYHTGGALLEPSRIIFQPRLSRYRSLIELIEGVNVILFPFLPHCRRTNHFNDKFKANILTRHVFTPNLQTFKVFGLMFPGALEFLQLVSHHIRSGSLYFSLIFLIFTSISITLPKCFFLPSLKIIFVYCEPTLHSGCSIVANGAFLSVTT